MIILEIVILAIFSGVVSFIVFMILEKTKFLSSKRIVGGLAIFVTFALTFAISKIVVAPFVKKYEYKRQIVAEFKKMQAIMPSLAVIEKYDNKEYNNFVNKFAEALAKSDNAKSDNASQNDIALVGYKYGQMIINKYAKKASDDVIISYLKAQITSFRDLKKINPDLICKLLFPQIFGMINDKDQFYEIMKKHKVFDIQEKLVIDGIHSDKTYNYPEGAVLFEQHFKNFAGNNKKFIDLINNIDKITNPQEKAIFADFLLNFYESILRLEKDKAAAIIRFFASQE